MLSGALDAFKEISTKKSHSHPPGAIRTNHFHQSGGNLTVARVVGMCLNLGRKPKRQEEEEGNTQSKKILGGGSIFTTIWGRFPF